MNNEPPFGSDRHDLSLYFKSIFPEEILEKKVYEEIIFKQGVEEDDDMEAPYEHRVYKEESILDVLVDLANINSNHAIIVNGAVMRQGCFDNYTLNHILTQDEPTFT